MIYLPQGFLSSMEWLDALAWFLYVYIYYPSFLSDKNKVGRTSIFDRTPCRCLHLWGDTTDRSIPYPDPLDNIIKNY